MSSLCEQHHCDCCVTDTFLWRDAVKQGHTELHTVLSVTVSVKVHKIGSVTVGTTSLRGCTNYTVYQLSHDATYGDDVYSRGRQAWYTAPRVPAAGCRLVEAPEVAQHSVDLAQSSALLHRVIQVTHSFQPLL